MHKYVRNIFARTGDEQQMNLRKDFKAFDNGFSIMDLLSLPDVKFKKIKVTKKDKTHFKFGRIHSLST